MKPAPKKRDKLRDAMYRRFNKRLFLVPAVIVAFAGSAMIAVAPQPQPLLSYSVGEAVQSHPGLSSPAVIPVTAWIGNQTAKTTANLMNLLRQNPDIGSGDLYDQMANSTAQSPYGRVGGWGVFVIYIHASSSNSLSGDFIYVVLQGWHTPGEYPVHASVSNHELNVNQIINE